VQRGMQSLLASAQRSGQAATTRRRGSQHGSNPRYPLEAGGRRDHLVLAAGALRARTST
jgi:hypothetical protein